MYNPLARSVPGQRLNVRLPSAKPVLPKIAHQSFRLTKPMREKMMGKAFGSYTPEAFKKHLAHLPGQTNDKERAYFARHLKDERPISDKETELKYIKGFLKEAHATKARLRSGYNPTGHEREQAERLIKEMKTGSQPEQKSRVNELAEQQRIQRQRMNSIRDRLGTTHGSLFGSQPAAPGTQTPEPIGNFSATGKNQAAPGAGWSNRPAVPAPTSPPGKSSLGSLAKQVFTGGFLTGRTIHPAGASAVEPVGSEPPVMPSAANAEPAPLPAGPTESTSPLTTPEPAAPAAVDNSEPPSTDSVHELPI